MEDAFNISELSAIESDRSKVIYEYGAAPLSENDKAGIIRFLLEGKFDGFNIRDVVMLLLILSVIAVIISVYITFF